MVGRVYPRQVVPNNLVSRVPEQPAFFLRRKRFESGTTSTSQIVRHDRLILRIQPQAEFAQRGVEFVAKDKGGRGPARRAVSLPDHVQDDIAERRIAIMAVRDPAAGMDVHFHVPRPRRFAAELNDGAPKIRSAFPAHESRMKHPQGFAVQGCEMIAVEALVLPDGLEQAFGRRLVLLVKEQHGAAFQTPLRIEVVREQQHLGTRFASGCRRCQAAFFELGLSAPARKIDRIERRVGQLT